MEKITKDYTALTPAYGRDYHSAAKAKGDFLAGRDFVLEDFTSPWDRKPCNLEAFASGVIVQLYYDHNRKSCLVKTP